MRNPRTTVRRASSHNTCQGACTCQADRAAAAGPHGTVRAVLTGFERFADQADGRRRQRARNLPFVDHVALMGLENTGFAIANDAMLWMDPLDYGDGLARAVDHLVPLASTYRSTTCRNASFQSQFGRMRSSLSRTGKMASSKNAIGVPKRTPAAASSGPDVRGSVAVYGQSLSHANWTRPIRR
jgi:hypothetical protein